MRLSVNGRVSTRNVTMADEPRFPSHPDTPQLFPEYFVASLTFALLADLAGCQRSTTTALRSSNLAGRSTPEFFALEYVYPDRIRAHWTFHCTLSGKCRDYTTDLHHCIRLSTCGHPVIPRCQTLSYVSAFRRPYSCISLL